MGTALSGSCCRVQGEGSCRARPPCQWHSLCPGQRDSWWLRPCFLASGLTPWLSWAQGGPASPHRAELRMGRLPALYSCVIHFTRDDCRSCACKGTSGLDFGIQPSLLKQGKAGGQIAAWLRLLNTEMWAHNKMEEGIALLLVQSRGVLLGLLPLRSWLLSLGCSVFLSRACCLWNSSAFLLVCKYFVRELIFLLWRGTSYLFHVSYSKGQYFLLLSTFIDVICLPANHKVFFSGKVLRRKLRYTFTDIFSNYIPLWMFLMLWIAYPTLTWSKLSETRAFFPGELTICTTCNSFKICVFPVQWLNQKFIIGTALFLVSDVSLSIIKWMHLTTKM